MNDHLTPAACAHQLFDEVKGLRAGLHAQGYGDEAIFYVLVSTMGRLLHSDEDKARLLVMVRDMIGDEAPIVLKTGTEG